MVWDRPVQLTGADWRQFFCHPVQPSTMSCHLSLQQCHLDPGHWSNRGQGDIATSIIIILYSYAPTRAIPRDCVKTTLGLNHVLRYQKLMLTTSNAGLLSSNAGLNTGCAGGLVHEAGCTRRPQAMSGCRRPDLESIPDR